MRLKNRLIRRLPWALGRDAVRSFIAHEGMMISGYLSYMALLSFFPFVIFLVALAGFFGDTALGTAFVSFMFDRVPPEVAAILRPALNSVLQENRPGLMTFSIAVSLYMSTSGLDAVRSALNRAFHVHARHAIWRRLLHSFLSTIVAAVSILIAMLVLVVSPVVLKFMQPLFIFPQSAHLVVVYVQWLVPPALLFGATVVLYWNLCSASLHWHIVWPGALLTVTLWMITGWGMSLYLSHFNRYPATYGSLGGAVILLIFFYALSLIFLLGAELNAAIMRRHHEKAVHEPEPDEEGSAGL